MTATLDYMMNATTVERRLTVERYVLGRLSPAELEAFEGYFFDNPEILDEVAAAEALRDGLADHPAFVPSPRWKSPLAQVAALVACVSLAAASFLYLDNQSLRGERLLAAQTVQERVYLSATRSLGRQQPALAIGRNALLEISVGPLGFDSYTLRIVELGTSVGDSEDSQGPESIRFVASDLQLDASYALALASGDLIQPGDSLRLDVIGVSGERQERVLSFPLAGQIRP